jgi:Flp pilus assembly pilin Flp
MRKLINRFRRDDEGAALVEYGMLVGLIAVICVVAVTTLGTVQQNRWRPVRRLTEAAGRTRATGVRPRILHSFPLTGRGLW